VLESSALGSAYYLPSQVPLFVGYRPRVWMGATWAIVAASHMAQCSPGRDVGECRLGVTHHRVT
jgi:hypothetical protein